MAERSKPDRKKLRRAKNAVRGAFNRPKAPYFEQIKRYGRAKLSPADLIVGGFSQLGPQEASEFLEWIKGFPSKIVKVFPTRPIQKPIELLLENVTIQMPLLTRLNWLSTILHDSKEKLAIFVDAITEIEQLFFVGEFDQAQRALDEIREQFGLSTWWIEIQIALLQRWKGLDAQKEFARSISTITRGRLAGVTAHWVSQRNEDNTAFGRFRARLERSIDNWNVAEPLRDAYAIILGVRTFERLPDRRASSALGALATSSLVDAYMATVSSLETVFMAEEWPVARHLLNDIVSRLPIRDRRVRTMAALLADDFSILEKANTDIVDAIACGRRTKIHALKSSLDIHGLIDRLHARAATLSKFDKAWPPGSPMEDLYELVEAAVLRTANFEATIEQGSKLLTNLRHFSICSAVQGLIAAQNPDYVLGSASPPILFFLNGRTIHPWHVQVLPRSSAIRLTAVDFKHSTFADMIGAAVAGRLPAGPSYKCVPINEIAARFKIANGDPEGALAYLQFDGTTADELTRRRLAPIQVIALLKAGRLEQAISAAAATCAIDPSIAVLLPLRELVEEARRIHDKISDKLSLAILFDQYLERYTDDDVFQLMQFAYEDYVLSKGVERPSELASRHDPADAARLIYFLRNVAIPDVMDVSFWLFKRSRDTLTERIAVCSALIELDPFNENDYREQIKEITKELNIQDGLEDVDRSRVYVDLPKLFRWAETELRESFERYQALLRAGVTIEDPGEFDKVLKDFAAGKGTLDRFANYPADEAGQLLLEIYNSIAEKYLHDPDIGLDAYLSMRIRHGSLAGHIRGPLEEQGLLAVRDHGTNQYRMLRTPAVSAGSAAIGDLEAARKCVEVFSRDVDGLIDTLTKERLQIKREIKPKGLFAFDPAPLIIYFLRANIHEGTTFPQFVDRVIDALQIYLSLGLQSVRKYITEDFSTAIATSVENFRSTIDETVGPPFRAELQELIGRVSPELQASVERVASWFAPDAENERRALRTMEQIVDIAIQATNNAHRGFNPKFKLDIENLGLQSTDTLIVFTDILFTILDNIYTHSGVDHRPTISISIADGGDEKDGGTRVRIFVTNEIAAKTKSLANERRLERIREQIESGDYRAMSKVEGGTGLLKLKRIVAADNRQTLDFGYRSDALEFFVEITMILVFTSVHPATGILPTGS